MVLKCVIMGCDSSNSNANGVSFHRYFFIAFLIIYILSLIRYVRFPINVDVRTKWFQNVCNHNKSAGCKFGTSARVCSKHFTSDECMNLNGKIFLRAECVPTIFPLIIENER